MNLRCGKQLPAAVMVYSHDDRLTPGQHGDRMSPANRLTSVPTGRRRPTARGRAPGVVYSQPSLRAGVRPRRRRVGAAAPPDLAARLRQFQRTLRGRIQRRDALLDMMRAVNATLEPPRIAALVLD